MPATEKRSNCGGYVVSVRESSARCVGVACGRWDCEEETCGPANLRYYYALMCDGLGLGASEEHKGAKYQLLTITVDPSKVSGIIEAWDMVGRAWQKLRQRIRHHYGGFQFVTVTEATKRGYPHLHIIARGLSDKIESGWTEEYHEDGEWHTVTTKAHKRKRKRRTRTYTSAHGKPTLSQMAEGAGWGRVCHMRTVEADNEKGAINYLTKYLVKSVAEGDKYPPHFRRVRYSQGWTGAKWEKRKGQPPGVGLFTLNRDIGLFVAWYCRKAIKSGFAPVAVMDAIKRVGLQEWVNEREIELAAWLRRKHARAAPA